MRHLLAPRHRRWLATFGSGRSLLAFDFDGTLAPITAERDAAAMRPTTQRLLARLCAQRAVAVISGRSLADLAGRLAAARPAHLIGNHGIEPGERLAGFADATSLARGRLSGQLAGQPGIDLEDKVYSLAVHFRRAPEPQLARCAVLAAVAALPVPFRVVPGKLVVNLLPPGAPDKGEALRQLCARTGHDTVLFVGDDVTDEDVFGLTRPPRLLGVRIGRSHRSAAQAYLRDQRAVDSLLSVLLELPAGCALP